MTKLSTALQALLGIAMVMSGIFKLTGGTNDVRAKLEVATWLWTTIGIAEIAGALLLLASVVIARLALPVAAAFSLFFLAAIGAHLRVGDLSSDIISPVVMLMLFLVIVAVRWNLFVLPEQETVSSRS